ncbi:MAG: ABC transporter ATP-binding protein [Acidimicrobiia bacterium]|nr:ABC transporter ATP-binding protein [bacterium]MXW69626.1 ABC transporter ATP-binding protein [Acidimicrobiia bacterium]MXX01840.1 ABC transporter ATP-binding protein [Acidimicrobiia bacterium]MYA39648.1 ABC transporter ATP-binding protein [Acidimicrobiia bacterium]MYB77889.1 ABC transporter ATP-binding protein [Acidimicrobiia bacterium]
MPIHSKRVSRPPDFQPVSSDLPLVDLVDVSVSLGGAPVLSKCRLTLDPGESLGVAGPNGAGKSTLLGVVATFISPTGGSGTVLGALLAGPRTPAVRSQIGWSGHLPALYPDLTLGENLALAARLTGHPTSRGRKVLTQVGLGAAAGIRAERCSNGMLRRADLARLLIGSPRLVLLDEPDAGLDQDAAAIIDHLITRTTRRDGAVLCVSHDAARLSGWVDRVVEMREGRIV